MTTKFIDTEKLASELETAIIERFRQNFERVSGTDPDQTLQALYISDAADMLKVSIMIKVDRVDEAREKLYYMDTAPREELYFLLEQVAGSEIVDSMFEH